jgi:hypothetical protein
LDKLQQEELKLSWKTTEKQNIEKEKQELLIEIEKEKERLNNGKQRDCNEMQENEMKWNEEINILNQLEKINNYKIISLK